MIKLNVGVVAFLQISVQYSHKKSCHVHHFIIPRKIQIGFHSSSIDSRFYATSFWETSATKEETELRAIALSFTIS
jgi:hypothetical protein